MKSFLADIGIIPDINLKEAKASFFGHENNIFTDFGITLVSEREGEVLKYHGVFDYLK